MRRKRNDLPDGQGLLHGAVRDGFRFEPVHDAGDATDAASGDWLLPARKPLRGPGRRMQHSERLLQRAM
jgi:hypothetical protein